MTHRENAQHGFPGMSAMLLLVTAIVTYGFWQASNRTAKVDDAAAGAASNVWPDMRIDINTAGVAELSLLPGLGDRLGQRIVEDRDTHGLFTSIDDLQRVSGMGDVTIERLRPYAFASRADAGK